MLTFPSSSYKLPISHLTGGGALHPFVGFTRASSAYAFVNGVYTDFATDVARFGSQSITGKGNYLINEGQRTNSLRNNTMVGGGVSTNPTDWSLIASDISGTGISADVAGVGTVNGLDYVDVNFSGTSTGGGSFSMAMDAIGNTAANNAEDWAQTSFFSLSAGTITGITSVFNNLAQYDGGGSILSSISGTNNLSNLTADPIRFEDVFTTDEATIASIRPRIVVIWTSGETIDFTLRIASPQLELGSFATSVIKTSGSAVTRSADVPVISDLDDQPYFNPSEATIFGSFILNGELASKTILTLYSDSDNQIRIRTTSGGNQVQIFVIKEAGGALGATANLTFSLGEKVNFSVKFKDNDFAISLNGETVVTNASIEFPVVDTLRLGSSLTGSEELTGSIPDLTILPGAVSDAQLQELSDQEVWENIIVKGVPKNIVDTTRPSVAWYFDEDDVLQEATVDEARLDYLQDGSGDRGYLIERQRTNSLRNNTMVGGSAGVAPTNWFLVASDIGGTGVSSTVVGVGTVNGLDYVDVNFSGTSTSGQGIGLAMDSIGSIAAVDAQEWTQSVFLSLSAGSTTGITTVRSNLAKYDSGSGFLSPSLSGTNNLSNLSADLVRFQDMFTTDDAATAFVRPRIEVVWTGGETIDFTLRIASPQLELGSFATSVIKTSGSAVTRSADVPVISDVNYYDWFNLLEGTIFAYVKRMENVDITSKLFQIDDGTSDESIRSFIFQGIADFITAIVSDGGVEQVAFSQTITTDNARGKVALAYKENDFAYSVNGAVADTDSSGTIPSGLVSFKIGHDNSGAQFSGWIMDLRYNNTRKSDTNVQNMTS